MLFIKNEDSLSITAKSDNGKLIESNTVEALLLFEIRYHLMELAEKDDTLIPPPPER